MLVRFARPVLVTLLLAGLAATCSAAEDPHAAPVKATAGSQMTPAPVAAAMTRAAEPIPAGRVLDDIKYLASPALEGRRTGEPGCDTAAAWIARQFQEIGLEPLGDAGGYLQRFECTVGVKAGGRNSLTSRVLRKAFGGGAWGDGYLSQDRTWASDSDFIPLGFSENDSLANLPVVFVGYGITAEDKRYDDYAGADVKGKAVLFFRHVPGEKDSAGAFGPADRSPYADLRYKVTNAFNHGAVAALVALDPVNHAGAPDKPLPLQSDQGVGGAHIPAVSIRREVAEYLVVRARMQTQGFGGLLAGVTRVGSSTADSLTAALDFISKGSHELDSLQAHLDAAHHGQPKLLEGVTVTLKVDLIRDRRKVANVVGRLAGSSPALKDQAIVLGGHYDHLGWGGQGSLEPDKHAIHFGADDNASGASGVIELARAFAAEPARPARSLVFVCFTGEEEGLFGSAYFVEHSPVPLSNISAMINMDMIGRLREDKVMASGTGTSPLFPELLKEIGPRHGLRISSDPSGYGPSDMMSFYAKDRPVLFFFTGAHVDYHKPSDTWDKINAEGEARVLGAVHDVASRLAERAEAIAFTRVAADTAKKSGGEGYGGGSYGPYLGTVPDFGENADIKGVKLSGVREGSPAEKAGIQGGDILVKFGAKAVANLYDYTYALREHKPGDKVEIVVLRGGKEVTLTAVLGSRK